jgi:hypothetical protein
LQSSTSRISNFVFEPTYVPLGEHSTQFPSMAGSTVFDPEGEHACLEACQADADCLAVSYVATANHTKCVLSPSPLRGDDVVWQNLAVLTGDAANTSDAADGAFHFTKSVPLRRLEVMADHVHDGAMLDQFCVEDISVRLHFCFVAVWFNGVVLLRAPSLHCSPSMVDMGCARVEVK